MSYDNGNGTGWGEYDAVPYDTMQRASDVDAARDKRRRAHISLVNASVFTYANGSAIYSPSGIVVADQSDERVAESGLKDISKTN